MKYYSLKKILQRNARYNVIFGERSNGKTYAVLLYALKRYMEKGEQLAIIRRWADDFTGKNGQVMFAALEANNEIEKNSRGMWTGVYYWSGRWYLCRYDDDGKRESDPVPFAYGFSLTTMEHDKSTSYPMITTVLFDEFIARTGYVKDEFVLFMNVLSTIIRQRDNVTIFMCGNTVNKYCPYFNEMGLKHVKNMHQGTIDVYEYGNSGLRVAVEYCHPASRHGKDSDIYFAFDNPKLNMITDGSWEIDVYPHSPRKIKPKDIIFHFYIIFDREVLRAEVVSVERDNFIFIHPHTKTLQDTNYDKDLIYSTEYDPRPNHKRNIRKANTPIESKICEYFKKEKIFYSDNATGEVMRNYLMWCGKNA